MMMMAEVPIGVSKMIDEVSEKRMLHFMMVLAVTGVMSTFRTESPKEHSKDIDNPSPVWRLIHSDYRQDAPPCSLDNGCPSFLTRTTPTTVLSITLINFG